MSSVSHRKESAVCPEGVCLSPLDELGVGGELLPPHLLLIASWPAERHNLPWAVVRMGTESKFSVTS